MKLNLRARIVLVQLVAVSAVLAFLGLALIPRLETEARNRRIEEIQSLAKVVAFNAEAPLYFMDEAAAAEAAEAARVDPEVRRVVLYDTDGRLFAIAPEGATATPTLPFLPAEDTFIVQRPIGRAGDWVGAVVLEVGTEDLEAQAASIRTSGLLSAGLGMLLAFVLAWGLEGVVSRRILELSRAIDHVRIEEDVKVRVPVTDARDEVTDLALRVNELLDAIDLREAQLLASHQQLEQRVADRTAQLQSTLHRTSAILQSLMDGLLVVDSDHYVREGNEAIRTLLGRNPVGEPLRAFLEPQEGDVDERIDRDVGKVTQWTLHRGDGLEPLPVEVSIALVAGEGSFQTVLSVRDISERLRLDRLKADFVSTVSHELRTPITAVYGSLRLVLAGVTGPIATTTQDMLQRAFDNSQRLIRLVNDLLDMQRVERGQLVISPEVVRLDHLVQRAVQSSEGYDIRGIPVRVHAPEAVCWVEADPDRIIQVLHNLLSNALKYSPDDGAIDVTIEAGDDRVRVRVTDQGPGIPPEFHDRMFGAFQQADSGPERRKPGTGLGLAVTKAIVEGHGGTIGFDSPPGEGATLWFELARIGELGRSEGSGPAA